MSKIDFLYQLSKGGLLNDSDLISLYKTDAESYDYENHKHNEKIEEILKTRNIRTDIAHLLHCPEDQIAYLTERMDPGVKYLYTGLHIVDLDTHEVLNGKTIDMKKFLDYKESSKEKNNEEMLQNCKKNSVSQSTIAISYKPVIKSINKDDVIKKIGVAVRCLSVAGTFALTASAAYVINEEDTVSKYISDHRYIVTDEKVRTDNNDGYYYLHNNIAKRVLSSDEDKDSLIYAVYKEIKQDAATISGSDKQQIEYNMDLIMKDLSFNSNEYNYNNFDEYLFSKNCINEQGNIDTEVYDRMMHEYISKMLDNNELTFNGGKTK